jgi:uncharacterized protein YdaU (DUF1376 family)
MAKDPAFLFYPNDWLGGTMYLSRHQKGCYMDLLIAQFNNGPLSLETIKTVLGQDQANWTVLSSKFKKDSNGNFFNERLATEIEKRKKFSKSRRDNVNKRYNPTYVDTSVEHMNLHMENGNRNENRNDFEKSEKLLIPDMQKTWIKKFPKYFLEKEKDFPALLKISSNVAKLVGASDNPLSQTIEEKNQIKHRWGEIVDFISSEDFFKNYSISQVDRHFQSILQKEKNGNKYSGSIKAAKGKFEITGTGGY